MARQYQLPGGPYVNEDVYRQIQLPAGPYLNDTTVFTLVVQGATHSHSTDAIALTQANTLAVADATHAHSADNVALTQANTLAVADATHAHSADNVALTQANTLAVADATHAHSADNVALTQANTLAVADATHAHSADNVALTQANTLAVADATHAHSADNVALTQANTVAVNDAHHDHSVSEPLLDLAAYLGVADATHAHSADNVVLRLVRIIEFIATTGLTLTAKVFEVGASAVEDTAAYVSASANRQMMYQAGFDGVTVGALYQVVAYDGGTPVATWYTRIKPQGASRSGNYADIVVAESIEQLRRLAQNKTVTDPVSGMFKVYADDSATVALSADLFETTAEVQRYRGQGAEVRGALA